MSRNQCRVIIILIYFGLFNHYVVQLVIHNIIILFYMREFAFSLHIRKKNG